MTTKSKKETPLMKQYMAIKAKYPGALLLFRVGDFYETFGQDAIEASKILEITLTKRANGAASHIELAGFPHHSLDTYLPKLVRAGRRVAICDQLEDPRQVKGIVKRGVTELVTPGLSLNDQVLDANRNNYLAAIHQGKENTGIAFLDLSTGEFLVANGSEDYVDKLIQDFQPKEIILSKSDQREIPFGTSKNGLEEWIFQFDFGYEKLINHFNSKNLKGYGIEEMPEAIVAAGAVLQYLDHTEHKRVDHIANISRVERDQYVWLDRFTVRNLELIVPAQADGQSLVDVLDDCRTPMGHRLLRKWIVLPLKENKSIQKRLDIVEQLSNDEALAEILDENLQAISDLERLVSKVATGRVNPRELNHLKSSQERIVPIREVLRKGEGTLKEMADQLDTCDGLIEKLTTELREDAPMLISQGNMINDGVDEQLDEYRSLAFSGKDHLAKIVKEETERTGISSLKIAYNKVFGYYLEVTHVHKDKVPEEWIRKQTLVNAERYITEELKEYEEKILRAESEISAIENRIYQSLISFAADYTLAIQKNARILAELDCLSNFQRLTKRNNYIRPTIVDDLSIDIKQGRHPVIEHNLPVGEEYVPNDVFLDSESQQIMIITGPNMAGKSALLRQTALIVLMAQMGCYVPAGHARIGIVDKVFTRVGASDNLSRGESTFMVEMTETASIMNNLSDQSLVLMDEIGRGTSTYDGISIAWSIVEHLHNNGQHRAKTLFATHYHELNELADDLNRVKNFNVSIKELENKVVFLRKLVEGGSEHSFGIHVAQMAGMPNEIVLRANAILKHLEKEKVKESDKERLAQLPEQEYQMNLFQSDPRFERVIEVINKTDINATSPVEALLKLNEIREIMKAKA
ncbi:MAG: DNA mismatch repair protein MutS [Cytophagales bacterium]|nr:DNA mismatch repair protein MutS [Cytophagales bacterium]